MLGWVHLWLIQLPRYRSIDRTSRLVSLPAEGGAAMQLKLFTVAYECYV